MGYVRSGCSGCWDWEVIKLPGPCCRSCARPWCGQGGIVSTRRDICGRHQAGRSRAWREQKVHRCDRHRSIVAKACMSFLEPRTPLSAFLFGGGEDVCRLDRSSAWTFTRRPFPSASRRTAGMALCGSLVIPNAPDEIAVMAKQLSHHQAALPSRRAAW
jgi:hypothetical protein